MGLDRFHNITARTKAGINQPPRLQPFKGIAIHRHMLRLPPHGLFIGYPKPCKRILNGYNMLRATSRRIDILDAQQQTPAKPLGAGLIEPSRKRVAAMERAIRARRKAQYGLFGR